MQKKIRLTIATLITVVCFFAGSLSAQTSAFTFQGRLNDNGSAANGAYDLQFTIYDAVTNGNVISFSQTNSATLVNNGLFTVQLDFGTLAFNGSARWLDIRVRTNGNPGAFTSLAPRQPLTSTPYAIQAANAASALQSTTATIANAVAPGAVTISALASNVLNAANLTGTIPDALLSTNIPVLKIPTLPQFEPTQALPLGVRSSYVAAADVNGDGRIDLISANENANTLSVLTNNGSGVFSLAQTVPVGFYPIHVAAADVNGDGRIDLISANINGNDISIVTNNGSGFFSLSQTKTTGEGPTCLAAVDINNDGRIDLISANHYQVSSTLSVLTNNGSGLFSLAQSPVVGYQADFVIAADVNGDGRIDLVAASTLVGTLSILTNNGSGFFTLANTVSFGSGSGTSCLAAADLNGDGRVDILLANTVSDTLTVLTNSGQLNFVPSHIPDAGGGIRWVTTADFNGDGNIDVVCSHYQTSTLSVLTNNGAGILSLARSISPGQGPFAVTAADLNADGRMDLISPLSLNTISVVLATVAPELSDTYFSRNVPLLTWGKLPDSSLSTNVALLSGGKLPDSSLSANVALLSGGKLPDNKLSPNVALLNANQSFTGSNIFQTSGDQVPWRVTTGTSGNLSVQMLGGGNSGFQSINFNGYYSGGTEFRYNSNKARWRMIVDQRNSSDFYTMEVFNGSSLLNALTLTTSGNLSVAGTVNGTSDKNMKTNFARVDVAEILEKVAALPLSTWTYKTDDQTKHVGPMAQDFYSSFGLGTDDKHISMVDADGVALAAIQGLNQKLSEKDAEIQNLQKRLADLEAVVKQLAPPK